MRGWVWQPPLPLLVGLLMLSTHDIIGCPHPTSCFMCYLMIFEDCFCLWGFGGDKLDIFSESQEHNLNSCHLQRGWCQTKYIEVPVLGEISTCTNVRAHTHTLALEWITYEAAEACSTSLATLSGALWTSPCPCLILNLLSYLKQKLPRHCSHGHRALSGIWGRTWRVHLEALAAVIEFGTTPSFPDGGTFIIGLKVEDTG